MNFTRGLRFRVVLAVSFFAVSLLAAAPAAFSQNAPFRRGDADLDGTVNLTDGVRTLNVLFQGAEASCEDALDADDSGRLELTDAVFLLNFLFQGGPPTPPPGVFRCGRDPTADSLSCETYAPAAAGSQCMPASPGEIFSVRYYDVRGLVASIALHDLDGDGDADLDLLTEGAIVASRLAQEVR